MTKKLNKEQIFINNIKKILVFLSIIIGVILSAMYFINGGLYSLLFDLRESKTVIIYSIVIIVLLCILVILNISDESLPNNSKKITSNSYVTVVTIIFIIIFGLLLIFTLIDFFLPIIVLALFLVMTYHLIIKLVTTIINKYGIK